MFDFILNLDFSVLYFIQDHIKNPVFDALMPFLSTIGGGGAVWIIACFIMIFFKKTRTAGITGLCAMAFSFIAGELILKNIFCRVRPCYIDTSVKLLVPYPTTYSFPSGHTASSFSCAVSLLIAHKKIGVPALILAFLIAFSRLYNFVHFPTDIMAGIILGVGTALSVTAVINNYKNESSSKIGG